MESTLFHRTSLPPSSTANLGLDLICQLHAELHMEAIKRVELNTNKLPLTLRLRIWVSGLVYRGRNKAGQVNNVVRLLGKRVAKLNTHPNELDAMQFVRKYTNIPIPRVYEAYIHGDVLHLVMEEVPGKNAGTKDMTPEQGKVFAKELADCVRQLRAIELPKEVQIGSTTLGSSLDHRLGGKRFGPFKAVADFHTYLRQGHPVEHWSFEPTVTRVHQHPERYGINFAHADLNPGNVMIDENGHITSILDWEFAGWYPEYWDYTKMYWGEMPAFQKFFDAIQKEPNIVRYPQELEAEQAIWKHMNPFSYDGDPWWPKDITEDQVEQNTA